MNRATKHLGNAIPALAWGVLVLVGWEVFVKARKIKPFLLPAPTAIRKALADNMSFILRAARVTATNALLGLVLGTVAAVAVAMIAQRFRVVSELIKPISSAFNTMPIVALGPVFYNLFGPTGESARRFVVALVVFFPVFVNMLRGLTEVDPVHTELMRSYAASDTALLKMVRLPNSLPFLITGLRVASSLAVIAAVVVEYFGGVQSGLGSKVASAMKLSQTPKAWAYITAAIVLGLVFFLAGILLERLAMPWQARRRAADS